MIRETYKNDCLNSDTFHIVTPTAVFFRADRDMVLRLQKTQVLSLF